MPDSTTREVTLVYTRSTPGTHVYSTDVKGVVCKQVYLAREAMPAQPPKMVTLVVAWKGEDS